MARMPDMATSARDHAHPMVPELGFIRRRARVAPQVWTLEIEPANPNWAAFAPGQIKPGQFNMITVFGVGEIPISLSGDPRKKDWLVHTVRAVGPVSEALAHLDVGDAVGIRGPYGSAWPIEQMAGRDVVILAGGLGLAPLRPALYGILHERARYGQVVLLYGTRSPTDILFRQEIETWRRRLDLDVEVTVDHARSDWRGHVGVVTSLLPYTRFDPLNASALVCGPEVMMRFAINALRDAGLEDDAIYLSMERNMKCAVGLCGHCQFGPVFVCRDGPVFRYDQIAAMLGVKEL